MRIMLSLVCLLLFGVMDANAAISQPLSRVAGVPVSVYTNVGGFNRAAAKYNLPGYPSGFAMYETAPSGNRIHLSPIISTTLTQLLNGQRPRQNRLAAFSIFALAREMGHVAIGDPMHGNPGHDDPGATAWAFQHYRQVAKQLGVTHNISIMKRRAARMLRQWERGKPPAF